MKSTALLALLVFGRAFVLAKRRRDRHRRWLRGRTLSELQSEGARTMCCRLQEVPARRDRDVHDLLHAQGAKAAREGQATSYSRCRRSVMA